MDDTVDRSIPRSEARRLIAGRGRFTADLTAPRLLHAAFLRSPAAHGRIAVLDTAAARAMPGVAAVLTAEDLRPVCKPMVTRLAMVPEHRPPPQPALAGDSVHYQGQPVALAVADSLDRARDAAEAVLLEIEGLPPATDYADPAHRERRAHAAESNVMLRRTFGSPAGESAAERRRFVFERQTGVRWSGRACCRLRPGRRTLTVTNRAGAAPDCRMSGRPVACRTQGRRLPRCRRRLRHSSCTPMPTNWPWSLRRAARPAGRMGGGPAGVFLSDVLPGIHDRGGSCGRLTVRCGHSRRDCDGRRPIDLSARHGRAVLLRP